MTYTYTVALFILAAVGFVPNTKTKRHTASVTIGGTTVWCKSFKDANTIADRVLKALWKRGITNPRYEVKDDFGAYRYNW